MDRTLAGPPFEDPPLEKELMTETELAEAVAKEEEARVLAIMAQEGVHYVPRSPDEARPDARPDARLA